MNGFITALIIIASLGAFVGLWVFVVWIIARTGWSKYAARYAATGAPPPAAERFGGQTLVFGAGMSPTRYKRAINAWADAGGVWLQPMAMFKAFHPMLHLRFADMSALDQRGRFGKHVEVRMKGGGVPVMLAYGRLAATISNGCGHGTMAEMMKGRGQNPASG